MESQLSASSTMFSPKKGQKLVKKEEEKICTSVPGMIAFQVQPSWLRHRLLHEKKKKKLKSVETPLVSCPLGDGTMRLMVCGG